MSQMVKRMIIVIAISSAVIMAGGVAFYRSSSAILFILGVAAMGLVNIAKVFLIERTVNATMSHVESKDGRNYVRLQYIMRFFLTGVVLVGIILITRHTEDFAAVIGAIIGVFSLQIAAISLKFMKFDDDVIAPKQVQENESVAAQQDGEAATASKEEGVDSEF